MAGAFRAAVRGTNTLAGDPAGGTVTVTIPTAVQAGDVMLAFLQQSNTSSEVTTAPAGWTKLRANVGPSGGVIVCWGKRAVAGDAGSSVTFTGTNAADLKVVVAAYSGIASMASSNTGVVGSAAASAEATSVTVPATGYTPNIGLAVYATTQNVDAAPNSLNTTRLRSGDDTNLIVGDEPDQASPSLARTFETGTTSTSKTLIVMVLGTDVVPNAPTDLVPDGAVTFDRTVQQRFSWTFSDPDPGDSQSKYDLRYRLVGAASWTVVSGTTPNQYRDFASGFFAAGDYEWQVRTYDSQNAVSAYSASAFFTAATPPVGPTITAPTNGATVGGSVGFTWSYPTQQAYQVRKVADSASSPGTPDTTVVYSDTGVVTNSGTRTVTLPFPVNLRFEHLQVRVMDSETGLWSPYSSVRVYVSFTPPPVPTLLALAMADQAAIDVALDLEPYNLLSADQASVETLASGYGGTGGTCSLARSTAQAFVGAASLAVTGAGVAAVFRTNPVASIPVVPGQTYMIFGHWRAATTARRMKLRAQGYNSNGLTGSPVDSITVTDSTTGWTRPVLEFTAPADATAVILYPQSVDVVPTDEVHYWDGAVVRRGFANRLLPTGSFETDSAGWASSTGSPTIVRTQDAAADGLWALRATSNAAGSLRVSAATLPSYTPVVPGETVNVAWAVKPETNSRVCHPQVAYYDAAGASVGGLTSPSSAVGSPPVGVFTAVGGDFVVPAGVAFLRPYLYAGATQVGDSFLFDAVRLTSGAGVKAYTDNAFALPPSTLQSLDLYRRETLDGGDGIRIATGLAVGTFCDHRVASGVDYQYLARAIGTNATTADGPWTG